MRWGKLPRRLCLFHDIAGAITSTKQKHFAAPNLNGR
jgi:hypothetical protein